MTGLFIGLLTEQQLLDIVSAARADIAAGRSITSYTVPNLAVTKDRALAPDKMLLEARYALQILNPDLYGRSLRTKRTKSQFT